MSVSKKLDINLFKREKKTLYSFLTLYCFLSVVIILSFATLYYTFQKDLMLQQKRDMMYQYSNNLILVLKYLHINFENSSKIYPRDDRYNSAIYDSDQKLIFSTLQHNNVDLEKNIYTKNKKIYFINQPDSYYLGSKYVVIEIDDNEIWKNNLYKKIIIYSTIAFFFMMVLGYFLLKLFIKPLKEALLLLDRFIKDTTHELNTPISTIVTNIETIQQDKLDKKTIKKINRIDIGVKTISNIYEDLSYLTLNNKIITKNESVDLKLLLQQRIEYFTTIANGKKIDIYFEAKNNPTINIDKRKIARVIDNLLSNAIKYNKPKGKITITLDTHYFCIADTGVGIEKENLQKMFQRYVRFDKSTGGFGIGLSIVSAICDEYNFQIAIESQINQGTKVSICW